MNFSTKWNENNCFLLLLHVGKSSVRFYYTWVNHLYLSIVSFITHDCITDVEGKCYSYVVVISQFILLDNNVLSWRPGADPGFQVRGGGALKIIATNGGRRENFWGISCEKSRFYAKKSYFFPILGGPPLMTSYF